jgi:hypothetical protein
MVDENTGKVAANGTIKQDGSHRRVYTSGKAKDSLIPADFPFKGFYSSPDKRIRCPISLAAANVKSEVGKHPEPFLRMIDFGVELDGEGGFPIKLIGGICDVFSRNDN